MTRKRFSGTSNSAWSGNRPYSVGTCLCDLPRLSAKPRWLGLSEIEGSWPDRSHTYESSRLVRASTFECSHSRPEHTPRCLAILRVLDFDNDDDPSVAYLETQVGARYLEHPAQLNEYRRVYELIYKQTVPIEEYLL